MKRDTIQVPAATLTDAASAVAGHTVALEALATMLDCVADTRPQDTLVDCAFGAGTILRSLARDVRGVGDDLHGLAYPTGFSKLEVVK